MIREKRLTLPTGSGFLSELRCLFRGHDLAPVPGPARQDYIGVYCTHCGAHYNAAEDAPQELRMRLFPAMLPQPRTPSPAPATSLRDFSSLPDRPRELLLLTSYCGNPPDAPGCTDKHPCPDCLALCNVFAEDGSYLRLFGNKD